MSISEPSSSITPSSLHYSYLDLWDNYDLLIEYTNNNKKNTELVTSYVKEILHNEISNNNIYSMLSNSNIGMYEMEGSFKKFNMEFKNISVNNYNSTEILCNDINNKVLKPLDDLNSILYTKNKNCINEGYKLQSTLDNLMHAQENARNKCIKMYQEVENAKIIAYDLFDAKPIEKEDVEYANKMNDKYSKLARELLNLDSLYVKAVKATRTFRMQYDVEMSTILKSLERIEMTRQHTIIQVLRQYLDMQENALETMLRSVHSVRNTLSNTHPERDLQNFIATNRSGLKMPPIPVYEPYKPVKEEVIEKKPEVEEKKSDEALEAEAFFQDKIDYLLESARKLADWEKQSAFESSENEKELDVEKQDNEFLGKLSNMVAKVNVPEFLLDFDPDKLNLDHFNELLATSYGRVAFSTILNHKRGLALPIPDREFEVLEKLLIKFLDEALVEMHIAPTKVIMIMAQTFFRKCSSKEIRDAKDEKDSLLKQSQNVVITPLSAALSPSGYSKAPLTPIQIDEKTDKNFGPQSPTSPMLLFAEGANSRYTSNSLSPPSPISPNSPKNAVSSFFSSIMSSFSDNNLSSKNKKDEYEPKSNLSSLIVPRIDMQTSLASPVVKIIDNREYLLQRVKKHELWHNVQYWRESFFDSVRSELKNHEAPQKWHTDQEQAEAINQIKNIVFSQLASYAHNMREFGLRLSQRIEFIRVMADIYELSPEQTEMIALITTNAQ